MGIFILFMIYGVLCGVSGYRFGYLIRGFLAEEEADNAFIQGYEECLLNHRHDIR